MFSLCSQDRWIEARLKRRRAAASVWQKGGLERISSKEIGVAGAVRTKGWRLSAHRLAFGIKKRMFSRRSVLGQLTFFTPRICRRICLFLVWRPARAQAEAVAGRPSRIKDTPQFCNYPTCENHNTSYIVAVVRNRRRAWRGAFGAKAKAEGEKILIWNRCNPLISPDSDE
jgi:hypothetical protein